MIKKFHCKQFSLGICHLFVPGLNVKVYSLNVTTVLFDPIGPSESEWTWEEWKWRILCITQSSSITGLSPSDCLVSYPGQSLGESYLSTEMQSVYFKTLADWAKDKLK